MLSYPDLDPKLQGILLDRQPARLRVLQGGRGVAIEAAASGAGVIAAAERVFAVVLLVLLSPFLLLIAAAVFLLSRRPPLVAHARVGQHGRRIWVLKLRTMWRRPAAAGLAWGRLVERLEGARVPRVKPLRDPRVTSAFAAFCRKYSIDELPQLWHVVRGQMSLVGPRPMTIEELALHYGPAASEILRVRPGLTGLWQVRGRSSLNYRQRRRLDLFLVRHWSVRLYLSILAATLPQVMMGKDAC